ncbi:MAG TPA: DNA adenine methylase [Candidatus Limnocylindrales bacterium]
MALLAPVELPESRIHFPPRLTPFIKWPGGKSSELPAIAAAAPMFGGRFIDPFVGGGSVLLATDSDIPAWANDACADLISLYSGAKASDRSLRQSLDSVAVAWDGLSSLDALYQELAEAFIRADGPGARHILAVQAPALRGLLDQAGPGLSGLYMARIEKDFPLKFDRMRLMQSKRGASLSMPDLLSNVEGAVRAAMYMAIRSRYNRYRLAGEWDHYRSADFFFLREFAYAAMFRFNSRDEFNVPYGGISYNRKSLLPKVNLLFSEPMLARLSATEWRSVDFDAFLAEASPTRDDFVFVDPPYDSDFSAYDNMKFGWRHQYRLKKTLESLSARVMVVIKDTPMIRRLYDSERWHILAVPKTYMWTIKSRNDREAMHLTITNYVPGNVTQP